MNYLLSPKITKYRTHHKCKLKNIVQNHVLFYGSWGITATEPGIITAKQIEATRRIVSKYTKNIGKMWVKIFPDHSLSKKAKDSRMGSGKGAIFSWVYVVNPGNILFEATEVPTKTKHKILHLIKCRIPIKIKIICLKI